ncbi:MULTISPECIES: glycosyltransferase [Aequorivita]|uniref:Glycosyltransferase family 4 protein n=1 Tax=Aequorivita iocasae TaxID=2803865 RepID=A0ABX7DPF6_9FLAO|nr:MULTISPECIES: glycosyltransferase [Aequorivita]QQX75959.1 glycosyltransferase family 4 protein [Aequorivita iocasae]UCA55420.1 glycosyltransferase family 4 protein [Aequorivita sp. F7]
MELVFVTEARFVKNRLGDYYADSSFNYELWNRYLESFSKIAIMARVKRDDDFRANSSLLSSGKNVSFIELPYYIGPLQYFLNLRKLKKVIKQTINKSNATFICRVPGNIGDLAIRCLINKNKNYGLEVVGDPWDVFARGSIKHPLRSYLRKISYNSLIYNVQNASAVLYVTNETLQKKYPVRSNTFEISASNVNIDDSLIAVDPKSHSFKNEYQIISIGSLAQMYKSPDILIKSIRMLKNKGINCKLIWLGDGDFKEDMEFFAKELNLDNDITFLGNVDKIKVREYLIQSDIFVLASRTEGLPRAIIEAMSVGLPCIATTVGGIPELLDNAVLVPKDNADAMAEKIKKLIEIPEFYNEQASLNLRRSHNYKNSVLRDKRKQFYQYLINLRN